MNSQKNTSHRAVIRGLACLAVIAAGITGIRAASNGAPSEKRGVPPSSQDPLRLDIAVLRKKTVEGLFMDLDLVIRFGQPTIEARFAGDEGNHKLVLTFSKPILDGLIGVESGNAELESPPTFSGKKMTVNLTHVKDGETIKLSIVNVLAEDATSYSGEISFRTRKGDINRDGKVDLEDVKRLEKRLSNPKLWRNIANLDIDMDGKLGPSDLEAVKSAAEVRVEP